MVEQVVLFTGVTEERAKEALDLHNGDILLAIDSLSLSPRTSGTKYIPPSPVVHDGLEDEVREKLRHARKLSDLLTFAPQNDLRGKAAHYPERPPQMTLTASGESEFPTKESTQTSAE